MFWNFVSTSGFDSCDEFVTACQNVIVRPEYPLFRQGFTPESLQLN